jgi:Cu(I)/Ag(I) efflux system membrane protein CusA/SilA
MYYPLSNLKTEFMPELEEGDLLYMPTTLPSISETKAKQLLQQSNKLIKEIPEVDVVFGKIGRAETSTDPAPLTMIETTIKLKDKSLWRKDYDLNKIIEELDNNVNIPSLTNAWVQPIKTRIDMLSTGIKTKIGIKLSGNNIQTLQDFGIEIEKELNKLPETKNIYSERVAGGKYIDIKPKKETFARYGLTQKDIQEIVKYAIGGLPIGNIIQGEERYQIHLRYPRSIRDNIEKLKKLPIATKKGYYISLGNIADIFITEGAPMIKSENGRLISWLYINTSNVDTLKYIEKANKIISEKIKIPLKHTYSFSGEYENIQSMQESMKLIIPITLLSIFILLIMIFNSTIQATIVMTTLPFALIGSFWYIYVLEFKFSIAVLVGLIALLGLAAEFGVIMLTYLNKYIDAAKKQENYNIEKLKDSIIEGAVLRVRPKAMTVLTIFLGLMPIMYGQGVGNEIMQKIAAPMIGGMLTAPLLSLFILPIMIFLYEKIKMK